MGLRPHEFGRAVHIVGSLYHSLVYRENLERDMTGVICLGGHELEIWGLLLRGASIC
jgi:hypothetical protein